MTDHAVASPTWKCFHCGFATSDEAEARDHFGESGDELALCKHTAKLGGLIPAIGYLWRKLNEYDAEDLPRHRASYLEFHALGAKHATELIRAEQAGYDKGLADGRAEQAATIESQAKLIKELEILVSVGVKFHRALLSDWAAHRTEEPSTLKLSDKFEKLYMPYWPEIEGKP